MAEYIERDAAIEKIQVAAGCTECGGRSSVPCICGFCDIDNAIRLIKSLPAADVAPVVRCRDCVKRGTGECPMEQDYPWISTESDAFCSQGERRDDNDGEP